MRHRNVTKTLGRKRAARHGLVADLATSLVLHDRIRTTQAKARVLRPAVERLVTLAKTPGGLAGRRRVQRVLRTEAAVKRLVETVAPRYAQRAGGYTRIRKVGFRQGDGAPIVQIEFVQ